MEYGSDSTFPLQGQTFCTGADQSLHSQIFHTFSACLLMDRELQKQTNIFSDLFWCCCGRYFSGGVLYLPFLHSHDRRLAELPCFAGWILYGD